MTKLLYVPNREYLIFDSDFGLETIYYEKSFFYLVTKMSPERFLSYLCEKDSPFLLFRITNKLPVDLYEIEFELVTD